MNQLGTTSGFQTGIPGPEGPEGFNPARIGARTILDSERFKELDRKQSYYECTHNDWRPYDFDGRILKPGFPTSTPLLTQDSAPFYVPLKSRRPSNPYRLPRVVVNAFTTLLFGNNRWPKISALGDPKAEDYAETLCKIARLKTKMIRARNLGGAMGTVGMSWCFKNGKPRVSVHNAKHLFVEEWEDRDDLVPGYVMEVYRYPVDEFDYDKQRYVRNWYWYRHDWTVDEEVAYKPILFEKNEDPDWGANVQAVFKHGIGECPFVWIQNCPTEEIDGESDYEGLFENFEEIDTIFSVIGNGAKKNLDPTLVMKLDQATRSQAMVNGGIKKGSDNALMLGAEGDASYLELAGTSITAGVELFKQMRHAILEVAQCVIPDPSEVAADGMSRIAMELVYAPMIARADVLRDQWGNCGIARLVQGMMRFSRNAGEGAVLLPQKVTEEPIKDENGDIQVDEDPQITKEDRDPGDAEDLDLEWGPYFPTTPADLNATVTAMSTGAAGKGVIDQQTAAEIVANAAGKDPDEVWKRLSKETQQDKDDQADQFAAGIGGKQPPPGGTPKPGQPGAPPGAKPNPFGGGDDDEDADQPKPDVPPKPAP